MTKTNTRQLSRKQMSIKGEAKYICACAGRQDPRVVTLGPLLFFSTQTGDAWVLDPSDGLARCLCRDGEQLPAGITESPQNFEVEWEARYTIEHEAMIFTSMSGNVRTVLGYPVDAIRNAIRAMAKPS
jgi:hypothetical protein